LKNGVIGGDSNNGKFNITSEPGNGTTVTIVLPKEKPI